jgi:hypothetical protein
MAVKRWAAIGTMLLYSAGAAGQTAGKTPTASANALPTADQVLAHYIRALGGEQALRKITSRVMKGAFEASPRTQEDSKAPSQKLTGEAEIDMAAPDLFYSLVRITSSGDYVQAYDGKAGWASDPQQGVRDVAGRELAELRRSSQFEHELRFRQIFPQVRVVEKAMEGDRPVWVLEATPSDGPSERFYFDVENGLLLRHDSVQAAPDGEEVPIEHRYSNYIAVDGVQIPSLLRHKDPSLEWQVTFTEIRNNLAIDPRKFAKPSTP